MSEKCYTSKVKEERLRLGLQQSAVWEVCEVTKQTLIRWEKGYPIPSDKLTKLAGLGFDVQYILTGVRSGNLGEVAEAAGDYRIEGSKGAGALSAKDEAWLRIGRRLSAADRARLQEIGAALAAAREEKDDTGD